MNERLVRLREQVVSRSLDPTFLFHDWYVRHHLEVVVGLSHELLRFYPDADADEVEALAWLHDIGKTLHPPDTMEGTPAEAGRLLRALEFDDAFTGRVEAGLRVLDRKENLDRAAIEVQIVSSADGCSHLTGPFMMIYWRENPHLSIDELMAENRRKAERAWTLKITLPEARAAFAERYRLMLELVGDPPVRFLGAERPTSTHG